MTSRPYLEVAEELGISETEVLDRLTRLRKTGIIRRIGGNFVPEKLGYVSTLCAARVSDEKIELFAETVNRYPGVTHNYLRDDDFNIWFTFIAPSMEEIHANLKAISDITGVTRILSLPATRVYKIKAHFNLQ